MKQYIVAATVAVALGLGYAGRADAQNYYGLPNGSSPLLMPSGLGTFNNFAQPLPAPYSQTYPTFGLNEFKGMSYQNYDYHQNNFFQSNGFRQNHFLQPRYLGNPAINNYYMWVR